MANGSASVAVPVLNADHLNFESDTIVSSERLPLGAAVAGTDVIYEDSRTAPGADTDEHSALAKLVRRLTAEGLYPHPICR